MSTTRVVVLRPDDPIAFMADSCAAAADAVNEIRSWRESDSRLLDVYTELVVAYARLVRAERSGARLAVIDHLIQRVTQARNGEIAGLAYIVDRLHGEITAIPAPV